MLHSASLHDPNTIKYGLSDVITKPEIRNSPSSRSSEEAVAQQPRGRKQSSRLLRLLRAAVVDVEEGPAAAEMRLPGDRTLHSPAAAGKTRQAGPNAGASQNRHHFRPRR